MLRESQLLGVILRRMKWPATARMLKQVRWALVLHSGSRANVLGVSVIALLVAMNKGPKPLVM